MYIGLIQNKEIFGFYVSSEANVVETPKTEEWTSIVSDLGDNEKFCKAIPDLGAVKITCEPDNIPDIIVSLARATKAKGWEIGSFNEFPQLLSAYQKFAATDTAPHEIEIKNYVLQSLKGGYYVGVDASGKGIFANLEIGEKTEISVELAFGNLSEEENSITVARDGSHFAISAKKGVAVYTSDGRTSYGWALKTCGLMEFMQDGSLLLSGDDLVTHFSRHGERIDEEPYKHEVSIPWINYTKKSKTLAAGMIDNAPVWVTEESIFKWVPFKEEVKEKDEFDVEEEVDTTTFKWRRGTLITEGIDAEAACFSENEIFYSKGKQVFNQLNEVVAELVAPAVSLKRHGNEFLYSDGENVYLGSAMLDGVNSKVADTTISGKIVVQTPGSVQSLLIQNELVEPEQFKTIEHNITL